MVYFRYYDAKINIKVPITKKSIPNTQMVLIFFKKSVMILVKYETQWKTVTIDVEQYAGKAIKLEFNVNNVGDNTYNSAVLIDNVLVA